MSRPPLQGRVEEIVIREPKPSWASRIGDVLEDVFSGLGAAVREYGPAVLQGLASSYSSSSSPYQSYDISPSSLSDYSSTSRTVRIQAPEPIKPRTLPEPGQSPRLMETYGRSLQERRARRQQQIEDLMATNEQAANRRGIAGQLGQYTQPVSQVQSSRHQAPVEFHPSQSSSHSLADFLNPSRSYSSPIQEDYGWIQDNLARAQRPVTWQEQLLAQQMQEQALRERQAIDAQIQSAQAQSELAEAQARMMREQQSQPLRGHVSYEEIPANPQEFFPASTYRNPTTRQTVDLNQKLVQGEVLTDNEILQVKLNLDLLHYSAKTDSQRRTAEILKENTQTRIVESILAHAPVTQDGLVEVYGLELYPEEAELAVTLDVEHFWDKESHLRPEEIQRQLKEFAIELWDVAYGEDIRTVLDKDAHPLQRVWSGIQFIPVMKITKLAKIGRFAKLFRKAGHLGQNPFKGKTPTQIHNILTNKKKFIESKEAFESGKKAYINPKTGRSYHIDPIDQGRYREPSHVDVNYRKYDANRQPVRYNRNYFDRKYGYEKRKYDL